MSLSREEIHADIKRMVASAHETMPEIDRDNQTLILTTLVMAESLDGIKEVLAVHGIGKHSVCEYFRTRGKHSERAFVALENLRPDANGSRNGGNASLADG